MNIEIANRLVELRKANNLSQEALAEKLGISRQAVSKWERAEASPDTDNLILLAKLYKISLDELLRIDEEKNNSGTEEAGKAYDNKDENEYNDDEYVHVGFEGVHVKDKNGSEVHVGWRGIHVVDKEDEVHIDKDGINVNGENLKEHIFKNGNNEEFPLGLIAVVSYIAIGWMFDLWHPGWLIFFMVPIISSAIRAVKKKRADYFAYPVLVILLYLYLGLAEDIWHPTWVLFLTIPVYYELVKFFQCKKPKSNN